MAQRLSIITLDDDERATLKKATDGRPLENVLRRLRKTMSGELDAVTNLTESRDITHDKVRAARSALQTRLDTLRAIPAVDDDVRDAAEEPLLAGIAQCDTIEREQFPTEATADPETGQPFGGPAHTDAARTTMAELDADTEP